MKRIYIAIALLAVSITLSIVSHAVFERKISDLSDGLYKLLDLSETAELDTLKNETEKFNLLWEKSSGVLHILTIHTEMDGAEMCIISLKDLLDSGNMEEYKINCIDAISELKNLENSEKLSLNNILAVRPPNLHFVHNF